MLHFKFKDHPCDSDNTNPSNTTPTSTMKIKVAYGIDMRLWKHQLSDDESPITLYDDLLTYICKSFQFSDPENFRMTFQDEEGDDATISCAQDFADAFAFSVKAARKSLKLRIGDNGKSEEGKDEMVQMEYEMDQVGMDPVGMDQGPVISSTLDHGFDPMAHGHHGHFRGHRGRGMRGCRGRRGCKKRGRGRGHRGHHGHHGHRGFHGKHHGKHHGNGHHGPRHGPSQEEIVEFLSDDVAVALLSDVLVKTFEAVQQSNFEIGLPDTLQAVVLSEDKYKVLTEHNVWPHFVNVLVPQAAPKIMFFAQMMGSQGQDMGAMVRQWVPPMLQVMRESVKQGGGGMFGGRHGRRHGGRGRGRGCHGGRGRGFGPFGRCGRGNWNQWAQGASDQMN